MFDEEQRTLLLRNFLIGLIILLLIFGLTKSYYDPLLKTELRFF
jgi:hypothetical protein